MSDATLIIAGLGPGDPYALPLSVLHELSGDTVVWLRTGIHPVALWLKERGFAFHTFDDIYEQMDCFEQVYTFIANKIIDLAQKERIMYAVPGHPMVAEESVRLIMIKAKESGIKTKILPAMSFIDAIFVALHIDPVTGFHLVDGLSLGQQKPDPTVGTIVTQVYNQFIASDIKLSLLEDYPAEHQIIVIRAAGVPGEEKKVTIPLYELDRLDWLDHLTCLYLPPRVNHTQSVQYPLDPLVEVMATLRSPQGCPWDKEQDHHSLCKYLLEESYEVLDAIFEGDMYNLCEELGDLLLQVVFHAQIASENNHFTMHDVIETITEKMIRRHPHVFGDVEVTNSNQVLVNWEAIKKEEKKANVTASNSLLDNIPFHAAALIKAQKVQKKVAKVGFDWPTFAGALDKVYEEIEEVKEAIVQKDRQQQELEIGDVLFAVVNLSRLLEIDAEVALAGSIHKFMYRFQWMEKEIQKQGKQITDFSLQELDGYWEKAKKHEKSIKL